MLEVGCGTGALAEAYRRINPDVRYLGVEISPVAAHAAAEAGRVDQVFVGDAAMVEPADLGLPEIEPNVDCLVFGDVLEHMLDPWAVLTRLGHWVRNGGQVLACIPNVQHYSVLVNLLRGKWEYQDEGLLDRTHLRFFTLDSMQELFARAGLKVFDIQPRWWPDDRLTGFNKSWCQSLTSLGIEPAAFATQTRAVQICGAGNPKCGNTAAHGHLVAPGFGHRQQSASRRAGSILGHHPGSPHQLSTGLQFNELDRTWPGEEKIFLQQRVVIPLVDHLRLQARTALARISHRW